MPVPKLARPESKPLISPDGKGIPSIVIGPVTPVLKKPDILPLESEPPVAVLKKPEMRWFAPVLPLAELKKPDIKINYVPVSPQTRFALLANGTIDLECGGTTILIGRRHPAFIGMSSSTIMRNT